MPHSMRLAQAPSAAAGQSESSWHAAHLVRVRVRARVRGGVRVRVKVKVRVRVRVRVRGGVGWG